LVGDNAIEQAHGPALPFAARLAVVDVVAVLD
jgi:hypothetical protein